MPTSLGSLIKSVRSQIKRNSSKNVDLEKIEEDASDDASDYQEFQNKLVQNLSKKKGNEKDSSNHEYDSHKIEYDYKNGTGELYM